MAKRKKIADVIDDTDDRHVVHTVFYGEVALGEAIEIDPGVNAVVVPPRPRACEKCETSGWV